MNTMTALIEQLRFSSLENPEAIALTDSCQAVSRTRLMQAVDALAAKLLAHNVRTLAIVGDNTLAWVVADLAARAAKVTCVPLPGFFSSQQQVHVLESAGVSHIIGAPGELESASSPILIPMGFVTFELASLEPKDSPIDTRWTTGNCAKITFTSGSTGTPKGVMLSDDTLDATSQAIVQALAPLGIKKHLCVLPLATLLENVAGLYASLLYGVTVHVETLAVVGMRGATDFDAFRFMATLNAVQPCSLILVPQLLMALVTAAEMGLPVPVSLKFIAVGGGKVSATLLKRAAKLGLPVFEGYGLSECGSVVSLNLPGATRPGSTGKALAHARIRISDDGEILVSGAVMNGYLGENAPQQTEVATGDLGFIDSDGFLHVQGRKKNMFITSFGRNVNPEWVESELTQRLPIAQAAVYGEAMPINVAVITPRSGCSQEQVRSAVDAVNLLLPDYARVTQILFSTEPFSLANGLATANGRIRRESIFQAYCKAIQSIT